MREQIYQQPQEENQLSPVFLNAVHPDLSRLYEPLQRLAEYFHLPIEDIHEGIIHFEVPCLTSQATRDIFCENAADIEEDLLRIERDYGSTLYQLAKARRLILLIPGFLDQPHIEMAITFGLLVAAMSGNWPDVLSVQFEGEENFHIMSDIKLHALLSRYGQQAQTRMIAYPSHTKHDQTGENR